MNVYVIKTHLVVCKSVAAPLRAQLVSHTLCLCRCAAISLVFIPSVFGHGCSFLWRSLPVSRPASQERDRCRFLPLPLSGVRWPGGSYRYPRYRGGPGGPGHAGKSRPRLWLAVGRSDFYSLFIGPETPDPTGIWVLYLNWNTLSCLQCIKL